MKITSRQSVSLMLGLQLVVCALTALYAFAFGQDQRTALLAAVATLVYAAIFFAHWRGWYYVRHVTVVLFTLFVAFGYSALDSPEIFIVTLMPPVLALVLMDAAWIVGSALAVILILLVRTGGAGVVTDLRALSVFALSVGGMVVARLAMNTAQQEVEQNARRAEAALRRTEEQAQQLTAANQQQEQQLNEQRRLLDLVATLEVPAVALADGVLFVPVVGQLDSRRAQALMTRLLEQTYAQRARLVVLDIAGVAMVDSLVAKALLDTAQALRLLGCQVTISGISAEVASTLTSQQVEFDGVQTVRSPQEALEQYARALAARN
jgi:rsbT co-antagonist protein RsbR